MKKLILFFLGFSLLLNAETGLKFEQLSLQEGIAYNLTYVMLQDSRGFIWFGTMFGLVRYDGENCKVYRNDPDDPTSISFDDIISLFEDSKGNIWIGTWGGGLNMFNPVYETFTRFIHEKDNPYGIGDNVIWSITEDKSGNIYLGTQTGGLNKYDPVNNTFTHYLNDEETNSIPSNSIRALIADGKGNLWIGTNRGLSQLNIAAEKFINYKSDSENGSISSNRITSLFKDSSGDLWIGTDNGLNRFNFRENSFDHFLADDLKENLINKTINDIIEKDNNLWMATSNGLYKLDKQQNKFELFKNDPNDKYSLSGNNINDLFFDDNGILWAACYNRGVNKTIKNYNRFEHYSVDKAGILNSGVVKCFSENADGTIYLGTGGNGIFKFNPVNRKLSKVEIPGASSFEKIITALAVDKDGILWIGTWAKLYRLNLNNGKLLPSLFINFNGQQYPLNGILSIEPGKDGNVWMGSGGSGLFVYYRNLESVKRIDFDTSRTKQSINFILNIKQGDDKRLYLGTYFGFIIYDYDTGEITNYSHNVNDASSLSNNYVFSQLIDSKGNQWIGTSNGLNKFIPGKNIFKNYYERDGLPNGVINGLAEDKKGNLWISTNMGLSKFNPEQEAFENFDAGNGLQDNLFKPSSYLKSSKGNFYFGSSNGFITFTPEDISYSDFNPQLNISYLKYRDDEGNLDNISYNKNSSLDYSQNSLEFAFAAADYTNPKKNKYKYMLEGFDNVWIEAGTGNKASYSDLPPGNYKFKVMGTNSDGIWSSDIAEVTFTIAPPFYRTNWFYAVSFLTFVVIAILGYKYRVNKKVKKALEIEKIREEEQEKIRKKTAADFHDDLGHRLTRITILTELIKRKLQPNGDMLPMLDKISENSHQLYQGTKDFIWAIDPKNDSLYELLIRLKDFGDEFFSDTGFLFEVNGLSDETKNVRLTMDKRRQIALIFKEGMNNALKHSKGTVVNLSAKIVNNELELILSDNGIGIPEEIEHKGNGLGNMKKRAQKIKSKLDIIAESRSGTKLKLTMKTDETELRKLKVLQDAG